MAIYEMTSEQILPLPQTTFEKLGVRERDDLQRLLRNQIDIVHPDLLVIAEAFREWEDSKREIDLLAIDKDANLVVIELKRTNDAGHADLQAIRYAAMVSAMTFEKAVEVYESHLRANGRNEDPAAELLDFLGWEEPDEDDFAQDVRILLVSADFSKELTTSVMWLNQRNLDIRCVRLRPYHDGNRVLVDVQQVIPLPEAEDYIVRIREKEVKERQDRIVQGGRQELRRDFWRLLLDRSAGKTRLFSNVSPTRDGWLSTGAGIHGCAYQYIIRTNSAAVKFTLYADQSVTKARFDWLYERHEAVERQFGNQLLWKRNDDKKESYLIYNIEGVGYLSDREKWPQIQDQMIEAMTQLEKAVGPHIKDLRQIGRPFDAEGGDQDSTYE